MGPSDTAACCPVAAGDAKKTGTTVPTPAWFNGALVSNIAAANVETVNPQLLANSL